MVERQLPKLYVEGSIPFARSIFDYQSAPDFARPRIGWGGADRWAVGLRPEEKNMNLGSIPFARSIFDYQSAPDFARPRIGEIDYTIHSGLCSTAD